MPSPKPVVAVGPGVRRWPRRASHVRVRARALVATASLASLGCLLLAAGARAAATQDVSGVSPTPPEKGLTVQPVPAGKGEPRSETKITTSNPRTDAGPGGSAGAGQGRPGGGEAGAGAGGPPASGYGYSAGRSARRRYSGRRIDLDFKGADIHNILRLLSDVGKVNIITSDDVKGEVTIKMRNVPWDQALDVILRSKLLGQVREGNLIRVAPLVTLEKELEQEIARRSSSPTWRPPRRASSPSATPRPRP